jgi:hypothetical protein
MALPHPAPRFDRQDYFAWEAEQPVKHEYVAGEVFAQAGARQNHVVVALATSPPCASACAAPPAGPTSPTCSSRWRRPTPCSTPT